MLWGMEPVTFLGITWDRMEVLIPMLVLSIAIGVVLLVVMAWIILVRLRVKE
jgi:hypothetical protein